MRGFPRTLCACSSPRQPKMGAWAPTGVPQMGGSCSSVGPLASPPSTLPLPRQSLSLQSRVTGTQEPSQGTLEGIIFSGAQGT